MKIIILGCGRVGQSLAEKLNDDNNDVTVIDVSAEKVRMVTNRYDVMGIVGNGATVSVQQEAGVADADLFIAVTDSDELNLLCCLLAKKEGDCQTIARVKNPEYAKETSYFSDEMGIAMVINPEYAAAEEIARVLRFPSAMKIEPFGKGKVELVQFRLQASNPLVGLSVKEVMSKWNINVIFCTIERGEEAYIANGDFVFAEKDVVSIVATPKNANEFFAKTHSKGHAVKNVMVVGGGVITHYLCEILQRSGIAMKIIEKDYKKCEELATRWSKADVIYGNAVDRDLLKEEGIETAGAFVALAALDEENILLSLFAKEVGVEKFVTKINRIDYDNVIAKLDLDTVICPKNIATDGIVRYVRATKNAKGSNIETLYNVIRDEVEAAEFIVKDGSPVVGIPLSELQFKPNVLIASILRGDKVLTPHGYDTIEVGDSVLIVTKDLSLNDIADVLE